MTSLCPAAAEAPFSMLIGDPGMWDSQKHVKTVAVNMNIGRSLLCILVGLENRGVDSLQLLLSDKGIPKSESRN